MTAFDGRCTSQHERRRRVSTTLSLTKAKVQQPHAKQATMFVQAEPKIARHLGGDFLAALNRHPTLMSDSAYPVRRPGSGQGRTACQRSPGCRPADELFQPRLVRCRNDEPAAVHRVGVTNELEKCPVLFVRNADVMDHDLGILPPTARARQRVWRQAPRAYMLVRLKRVSE